MTPLILTTEEVCAALAGTLTEIRRPVAEAADSVPARWRASHGGRLEPAEAVFPDGSGKGWIAWWGRGPFTAEETARCYPGNQGFPSPFGAPGDLLWVKEAFARRRDVNARSEPEKAARYCLYRADGDDPRDPNHWHDYAGWGHASRMPLWASRLTLRNCGVCVWRVDGIWTWVGAVERVNRPDGSPLPPREIGGAR